MASPPPFLQRVTDPPGPGWVKLRIRSDGTYEGSEVLAVDSDGRELVVDGVQSIEWTRGATGADVSVARLAIAAPQFEVEVCAVELREARPAGFVCSGCGAPVEGGIGAVLPDDHQCAPSVRERYLVASFLLYAAAYRGELDRGHRGEIEQLVREGAFDVADYDRRWSSSSGLFARHLVRAREWARASREDA